MGAAAPGAPAVTANAEPPREERSSTAENDSGGELITDLYALVSDPVEHIPRKHYKKKSASGTAAALKYRH